MFLLASYKYKAIDFIDYRVFSRLGYTLPTINRSNIGLLSVSQYGLSRQGSENLFMITISKDNFVGKRAVIRSDQPASVPRTLFTRLAASDVSAEMAVVGNLTLRVEMTCICQTD